MRTIPDRPTSRRDADHGFTLLEVMVVVLVIGVLLAVAIPTFLGVRTRAQDRAAQATVRAAQTTAMGTFAEQGDFIRSGAGTSRVNEPGLVWVPRSRASTDDSIISVSWTSDGRSFAAAVMSDSGTCFGTRLSVDGPPRYGSSDSSPCTGTWALTVADPSW